MDKTWSITFEKPVRYREALSIQLSLLEARQKDEIPDVVLLLQHTPTVTIGNRGRDNYLLKSLDEYSNLGIDVHHVERGGDVTYHSPGQWVLYPILHLGKKNVDSHGYLFNLEEIAIQTMSNYGIYSYRRKGKSGAWTDQGKVAAIGFRLKKWVSFHGMSFNVNNDLNGFNTIVPCGLEGENVTSLENLLFDKLPSIDSVGSNLLDCFEKVMDRNLVRYYSTDDLPSVLFRLTDFKTE